MLCRRTIDHMTRTFHKAPIRIGRPSPRWISDDRQTKKTQEVATDLSAASPSDEKASGVKRKPTQLELDAQLQSKLKGAFGDDSGIEFEDGQPVSMKRSVKNNMFRYI
ncbi:hypothetical protein CAC42_6260 [Sphaceloma murrayae]|uniref:Uncharacterized protein n=1 Tax=Sphaceloma murrayae TaxID=2082308 RepID=A0A2K1QU81_9PEZI|nr:hypothetical protein CAC42_6260 [Sphaceloma murrayae]